MRRVIVITIITFIILFTVGMVCLTKPSIKEQLTKEARQDIDCVLRDIEGTSCIICIHRYTRDLGVSCGWTK